jgi:3-hydroxyacyl-[acyl-carrier-protein] dehydratase
MPPPLLVNPVELDLKTILADKEAIRQINPQRFEMEQLDAICLMDTKQQLIVGYKDVRADEFWVHGHFPELPLMPGVLICEAAAQLICYYTVKAGVISDSLVGFGGMEAVRFRGPVKPEDRLVLVGKAKRLRRIQTIFNVQGFVGGNLVFHGDIIGVPLDSAAFQ